MKNFNLKPIDDKGSKYLRLKKGHKITPLF